MATETLIWLIPLPPLLAFFLIVVFTNRWKGLSHSLAVGAALLSWIGSMVVFFIADHAPPTWRKTPLAAAINWLPSRRALPSRLASRSTRSRR